MSDDQFTKLFKYMQREFKEIHEQLDLTATKDGLTILTNAVDAYAKQKEQWILKVAEATGVKLSV